MGSEILAIPEEHLEWVIEIIETGIKYSDNDPDRPKGLLKSLGEWCNDMSSKKKEKKMNTNWLSNFFDDRQRKEIEFCRLYAEQFSHGTDGHNAKIIVARMTSLLNEMYQIINRSGNLDEFNKIKLS